MKKWGIISVCMSIVIILLALYLINSPNVTGNTLKSNSESVTMKVTEENLASYLSLHQIVQDMPSKAVISLKTSDKEYIIQKGSVTEAKAKNPDITIAIPSSYIPNLSDGLCKTLSDAYKKGDVNIQLHISKLSATWKYKSLFKYRECLGI